VAKYREARPVDLMREALGVSRSGFYGWPARPRNSPASRTRDYILSYIGFIERSTAFSDSPRGCGSGSAGPIGFRGYRLR